MRIGRTGVAVLIFVLCGATIGRAQSELVTQVQAADVLSDLITYTNSRADLREAALKKFIAESGKQLEFEKFKPTTPLQPPPPFSKVFQGAVMYVKSGGGHFANPTIKTMSESQLTSELTELQVYNIQEFMKLGEKKKSIDTMRAFLTSVGELDKYKQWSKDSTISQAPAATAQDVEARMDETMKAAKAIAWSKAQARGVSEADFEKQWTEQVKEYKEAVKTKVEGVKSLAQSLSEPPPAQPAQQQKFEPPAVALYPQAPPPPSIQPPSLPPTVQSKATNEMYQQQNNELWNRFDD